MLITAFKTVHNKSGLQTNGTREMLCEKEYRSVLVFLGIPCQKEIDVLGL